MRTLMIVVLLLSILARVAPAQNEDLGWIGVFADEGAGSCRIADGPGVVTAYILHAGAQEANTSQFKLEIDPAAHMTLLAAAVNPDYLYIGDVLDGITITYRECKQSFPLKLATLTLRAEGTTTSCGALRIVADPNAKSGQVEVVDCSLQVRPVRTSSAWVNRAGDCICVTAKKATITTVPVGLQVTVDGKPCAAPCSFWWDPGTSHEIGTTHSQGPNSMYTSVSWSDGGAPTHTIVMADHDTTFTATFKTAR